MKNQFNSEGGEQNSGQGDGAMGKQVNNYGVPFEDYRKLGGKLDVTESALASFFKVLEEQQVPRADLDAKLREIAAHYRELLLRMETVQSADPEVVRLKGEARQAIKAGDYPEAEELLEQVAKQYSIAAAETYAELADLQRVRLRYAKAAEYWHKAADLLPDERQKERSLYLHQAGYDFDRVALYDKALPLYEQSLSIRQEIGDRAGEGATLSNIGALHHARGEYGDALKYLEQSLSIRQEIGDRAGEGTTLNNISQTYKARGDYAPALKYLEQSLRISQEIDDRAVEGTTLNNLATTAHAKGEYGDALKYLEQSLSIRQEIGDRAGEAVTCWNIGSTYEDLDDLVKAEEYLRRAAQLMEQLEHPELERCRKKLEQVRAALRAR